MNARSSDSQVAQLGSYSTPKLSLQHDDTVSRCESWLSLLVFELQSCGLAAKLHSQKFLQNLSANTNPWITAPPYHGFILVLEMLAVANKPALLWGCWSMPMCLCLSQLCTHQSMHSVESKEQMLSWNLFCSHLKSFHSSTVLLEVI